MEEEALLLILCTESRFPWQMFWPIAWRDAFRYSMPRIAAWSASGAGLSVRR